MIKSKVFEYGSPKKRTEMMKKAQTERGKKQIESHQRKKDLSARKKKYGE